MNSEKHKNRLKGILESTAQNIDEIYYLLKEELEEEILQRKEKIEKRDEETSRIYDLLLSGNEANAIKLIKSKLPLRIKLFNKVKWRGHGVYKSGEYIVWFNFNNDISDDFAKTFTIREVKEILKYKE
jgi:glycerophosphoryl diester phosphodiesterase